MFGRRISRALRRRGRPNVLAMLQHANQLFVSGNYTEATQAFEQLARGAVGLEVAAFIPVAIYMFGIWLAMFYLWKKRWIIKI